MASFSKAVALVTGGSGVVGSGVVYAFLQAGALVIAPVRNEKGKASLLSDLDDLGATGQANLSIPLADVSDPKSVAKLGEDVRAKHGKLDHVVTCVGGWWQKGPILQFADLESSYEEMLSEYKSHVLSHYLLAKVFMPLLKESPQSSFTFITGAAGEAPLYGDASMITAQVGALMILIKTIQAEVKDKPYQVHEFCIATIVKRHAETANKQYEGNDLSASYGSTSNRAIGATLLKYVARSKASGKVKVGQKDVVSL